MKNKTFRFRQHVNAALAIALLSWAFLTGLHAPAAAQQISQEYLGLTVSGNLELAPGKTLKDDGAVLLIHDTLSHHTAPTMASLQAALKSKGVNSAAVSLSLGLNKRPGPFDCKHEHDHRHGDASDEIVAWVEWLQSQGTKRVAVLGLGRGAAQAALSAAERQDLGLTKLVLAGPATVAPHGLAAAYELQFGTPLAPLLDKAKKLVEEGEGDTLLTVPGFLSCKEARTTAAAFVDYYGGDVRQDAVKLLAEIKPPTLIVVAGAAANAVDFEKTLSQTKLPANVTKQVITGANTDFAATFGDKLADTVVTFVLTR